MSVPFFRPQISEAEIAEVADSLRSGWLTTGPKVRRFEEEFAAAVGGRFAVAVNSATAALHLAVEALGLRPGQGVLVPTHTFAATAEVVRYLGAIPILVDAEPSTLNMDLEDAEAKLTALREGRLPAAIPPGIEVVGVIPVHVGGLMMDVGALRRFAARHRLWVVEDAAHAFPSSWRADAGSSWVRCGEGTSAVACFSFYANKTITTGEGGMAVTDDPALAERMRLMSLHGLSKDAWGRYAGGPWDYRIVAPGFKYNLTDVAAAIGIHQLARAEAMRREREQIAAAYREALSSVAEVDLPVFPEDRLHSWHLFPIRLRLERLTIDRDTFVARLRELGIGFSVHWRPLHLHPYYEETFGWRPEDLPVSTREWPRLVSLPIFPGMTAGEIEQVVAAIRQLAATVGC
ncbi:MAG: DegT/DnrJ/EryC1/StrS family aminotransferase [Holophagales bacterium]|nr:MAG: DegT/DnrJ/EryC1/StrS family aminotransferase [Holophagales bacterium]